MTKQDDMKIITIPEVDNDNNVPQKEVQEISTNDIFHTDDIWNKDKIMILTNGNQNKPGIISNERILKKSLNDGSQIPHIKQAKAAGYGVIVVNGGKNGRNLKYC